ncbi:MAG: peptidase M28, partial [Chryseobacterium artocarpi]
MKKILGTTLLLLGMTVFGQSKEDSIQFSKISLEVLNNGKSYNELRELTKNIGHRLSGSEAYEKSVKWAEQKLRDAGADKVWLQEVMIPVWVRGKESLHI